MGTAPQLVVPVSIPRGGEDHRLAGEVAGPGVTSGAGLQLTAVEDDLVGQSSAHRHTQAGAEALTGWVRLSD